MWLVPVFGAWLGWKLTRAGSGPRSLGRALGLTVASLAVLPLFAFLAPRAGVVPERLWRPAVPLTESVTIVSVFVAFAIVGLAIGILAWPALGRTLLAYGLAARIPIALLMLVPMPGNWGRLLAMKVPITATVTNVAASVSSERSTSESPSLART